MVLLEANGIKISMTAKASPHDNAIIEVFFRTIKQRKYICGNMKPPGCDRENPIFIKDVYNTKRLHSSLGYRSPEEFEHIFIENNSCEVYSKLR